MPEDLAGLLRNERISARDCATILVLHLRYVMDSVLHHCPVRLAFREVMQGIPFVPHVPVQRLVGSLYLSLPPSLSQALPTPATVIVTMQINIHETSRPLDHRYADLPPFDLRHCLAFKSLQDLTDDEHSSAIQFVERMLAAHPSFSIAPTSALESEAKRIVSACHLNFPLGLVALWRGEVFGFMLAGYRRARGYERPPAFLSAVEQQVHAELERRETALAESHGQFMGPGSWLLSGREALITMPELEYLHVDTSLLVGGAGEFHSYLRESALLRFLCQASRYYVDVPIHVFCHGEEQIRLLTQHHFSSGFPISTWHTSNWLRATTIKSQPSPYSKSRALCSRNIIHNAPLASPRRGTLPGSCL
jgi:hypothetical protein